MAENLRFLKHRLRCTIGRTPPHSIVRGASSRGEPQADNGGGRVCTSHPDAFRSHPDIIRSHSSLHPASSAQPRGSSMSKRPAPGSPI
eukprot:9485124-Pyramimonas_sp.AAC.1